MGGYVVFLCPRCGLPRYARIGQKSAKCFGCGGRIVLSSHNIRILLKTRDVNEAIEAVKRYKEKAGFRRHL